MYSSVNLDGGYMKRSFVCSQWFLLSSETTASRVLNGLQLSYNSNLSCLSCPDFSRDTYDCIPNDSDHMTIVCFENGFDSRSVTRLSQRLLPNVVLKFYQIRFFFTKHVQIPRFEISGCVQSL
jgi:hypothetical protein